MRNNTIKLLCELTTEFYNENNASFASTRTNPWSGWKSCFDELRAAGWCSHINNNSKTSETTIFDLACGNLRFKTFIKNVLPTTPITYYAIDNCDELACMSQTDLVKLHYQNLDIADALINNSLANKIKFPPCNISVCFGFMHHIPTQEYRSELLSTLVRQTQSNGYVIISFWQFLNDKNSAKKAHAAHTKALEHLSQKTLQHHSLSLKELTEDLDTNDLLLGWQNKFATIRYCHSFSNTEISQLAASVADYTSIIANFTADGKNDNGNSYLILKVN